MLSQDPITNDDTILHGIDSTVVLENFGYIFKQTVTGQEAQQHYVLSYATTKIQRFLSHSWTASRASKWAALSDMQYRLVAIICAWGYWSIAVAFGLWARLASDMPVASFTMTFWCYTGVPMMILLGIFVFGNFFIGQCLSSSCFLDKICIHQTDPELKKAAVMALEDFVSISERLTVLWSDDYFERLWCVFEVAVFGNLNGALAMEFLPLWASPFLYGMMIVTSLVLLSYAYLQDTPVFMWLMAIFGPTRGYGVLAIVANFLPAIVYCILLRNKALRHLALDDLVANFKISSTKVTVESDREIVYRKICDRFNSTEEFEMFVQTDLRKALNIALGSTWNVPYTWGLFVFQPYIWYSATDVFAAADTNIVMLGCETWVQYLLVSLVCAVMMTLTLPFALKAVGLSTIVTVRFPCIVGWVLDMFIHLLVICVLMMVSTVLFSLLGSGMMDNTIFGPIPVGKTAQ